MDAVFRADCPMSPVSNDSVAHQRRTHFEVEAPDRGDSKLEAPESRTSQAAEAPDAGEGRGILAEHDFTRGRSQT